MVIMSAYFFQRIILANVEQLNYPQQKEVLVHNPHQQWAQNGREGGR